MHISGDIGLNGVDICAETQIVIVRNDAQYFEWKGYGLKLHIEEKSLPKDIEQMTIYIMVSITGHYDTPEGYQRVSPVFWFVCDPMCKFEITLEMQHCVVPEHASDLMFARADCSQKKLPYNFELLKGGQFSVQSSYGRLELNKFSAIATFVRQLCHTISNWFNMQYCAYMFYLQGQKVDIVVTWNTDAHLSVSACM